MIKKTTKNRFKSLSSFLFINLTQQNFYFVSVI